MALVRVAPVRERLERVSLERVPLHDRFCRLDTARRLREKRWEDELRPDHGYSPPADLRLAVFDEAVELVRAALYPKREHRVPESAVTALVEKGRYER